MMKIFFLTVLCVFLLGVAAHAQPAAQFFSAMPDVPLMTGLRELPELTMTFDKPEGRIVESVALIESADEAQVKRFYKGTLPQMGWKAVNDSLFVREGEELSLIFEGEKGQQFLKVMVRPQG